MCNIGLRLFQRFYASLSDIKTEVEDILREGRQAVEDGRIDDHVCVSGQLDAMKALYNRVGSNLEAPKPEHINP